MDAYQRLAEGLPSRAAAPCAPRDAAMLAGERIDNLPLVNPALAARRVDGLLDEMLEAVWPPGQRIAPLAALRGPIENLCRRMWQQTGAAAHPFSEVDAEQAALARSLQWKLARGWAAGVHELCAPAGTPPRFKRKMAAGAIIAGLVHAGRALVWSYRQYRLPEPGVWRLVHALYAFAVTLGVAEQVGAGVDSVATPTSPRDAYVQALLLALAGPYRLAPTELAEASGVLAYVAPYCVLGSAGAAGIPVDTDADDVLAGSVEVRSVAGRGCVVVDVRNVVRVLEGYIAALPQDADRVVLTGPGSTRVEAKVDFLHRLGVGWKATVRGHARLAASHALDMVGGMTGLHYALAGNLGFATFLRRIESGPGTSGVRAQPAARGQGDDAVDPRIVRAEVLDQSEGGYQLRVQASVRARLLVGELVGLAVPVDGADERGWMVGVTRWIRQDAGELRLGIELLGRVARAAGVRPVTDAGAALAPQRAVELPGRGEPGGVSLLMSHRFARHVAAVGLALPPLASEWGTRATVDTWRSLATEPLGAACVQISLVRDAERALKESAHAPQPGRTRTGTADSRG